MNTQDLIKQMSMDLGKNPHEGKSFFGSSSSSFLLKWFLGAILLVLFFVYLLPVREDLAMNIHQPQYLIESGLWFLIAAFTARLVFLSAIPGRGLKKDAGVVAALILTLVSIILFRSNSDSLNHEVHQELDWYRGRCGGAILFVGFVGTAIFTTVMRKGAPTRLSYTSVGIALSSGTLASFVLQFACVHENSLHIFIWHFTPVVLLSILSAMLGRFTLRW